ncbi:MAG: hypothetical protein PUD15_03855 [Prevotella sp.]|nr:hypothetical protein [Prevotella sp.]
MLTASFSYAQEVSVDTVETEEAPVSGSVAFQTNYGRHFDADADPTLWDFPHIVVDLSASLGRGWHAVGEFEYERFRQEGAWQNYFRDNYTTNLLYLDKQWSQAAGMKVGILNIPVGILNNYGPALTIYDPNSEVEVMPATWHDFGVSFYGTTGKIDYQAATYFYSGFTARSTRFLGGLLRADYRPVEGLRVGTAGFYGTSHWGMLQLTTPIDLPQSKTFLGSVDADYQSDVWNISGSFIYSNADAHSVGVEAGYDVAAALGAKTLSVVPFARYDNWRTSGATTQDYIVGLHVVPLKNFELIGQFGRNFAARATNFFDLSFNYTWEF